MSKKTKNQILYNFAQNKNRKNTLLFTKYVQLVNYCKDLKYSQIFELCKTTYTINSEILCCLTAIVDCVEFILFFAVELRHYSTNKYYYYKLRE